MSEKPAHFIREWRLAKGFSQTDLAKLAEMSPAALSVLESGGTNYTQRTLAPLAKALGESPGTLLDRHPEQVESERGSDFVENVLDLLRKIEPNERGLVYDLLKAVAKHMPKEKKNHRLADLIEPPQYKMTPD